MTGYPPRLWTRCLAVAAVWCLASAATWACNVPVFRYALERWPSDPYHLTVICAGEGEESVQAVLDTLAERPVNLDAEVLDVDQLDADDWRLSGVEIDRDKLPWAVLRYPPMPGPPPPIVWSGRFDAEVLAVLTQSNVRQEVVRRLLTGESAVWVLIESGDREKDDAARETLEQELAEATRELRIPGMDELDYTPTDPVAPGPEMTLFDDGAAELIPLKVDFSLISLSRDNAAEEGFLAMLLGSEPDLHEYADEPMVFPIFGQGRALWALVGQGISARNIIESCMFLTGPCSCQIKNMNPGTDLLMDFDWYGALEGRVPPPPEMSPEMLTTVLPLLDEDPAEMQAEPPATEIGAEAGSGESTSGAAPLAASATVAETPGANAGSAGGAPLVVVTGAMLGGLLLIVATATVVLLGRKRE